MRWNLRLFAPTFNVTVFFDFSRACTLGTVTGGKMTVQDYIWTLPSSPLSIHLFMGLNPLRCNELKLLSLASSVTLLILPALLSPGCWKYKLYLLSGESIFDSFCLTEATWKTGLPSTQSVDVRLVLNEFFLCRRLTDTLDLFCFLKLQTLKSGWHYQIHPQFCHDCH